jgi:hypothetical protein
MEVGTVKGFWRHTNGDIYAIESTTFGKIVGAAGPLEADKLGLLDDYEYKRGIVDWIERAVGEGTLRLYRRGEEEKSHHSNKTFLKIKWIRRLIARKALIRRFGF